MPLALSIRPAVPAEGTAPSMPLQPDPPTPATDTPDPSAAPPEPALGVALLTVARNAIAAALRRPEGPPPQHPGLLQPGASFVTLTRKGRLRGCIGALQSHLPLGADVRQRARQAAMHDSRFTPLKPDELDGLLIEVAVVGSMQPLQMASEADLLATLRPNVDGLVLQWLDRRATFLPQVWQQLAQPQAFVRALKRKASLGDDFWSPDLQVWRYAVHGFGPVPYVDAAPSASAAAGPPTLPR